MGRTRNSRYCQTVYNSGDAKAENCYLYGIAGRSKEKAEQFQEQFGFEKAFHSLESMLEDDMVEAVYIPLPNTMHKEWVIKAAKHGKHVLCEKPLAGTEADVKEMIEACEKNGVLFMEAFAYLHSPLIRSVKETIHSGAIENFLLWNLFLLHPDIQLKIFVYAEKH